MNAEPASFTVLVLAGSRGPDDPVARAAGVAHKCLAPVAGTPMLLRVLSALANSAAAGHIAVSLEQAAVLEDLVDAAALGIICLDAGPSPGASVLAAADALGRPLPLLVTTADHALLTAEMVDEFCRGALEADADIVAGLATEPVVRGRFPDARRTFLKFRDGGYCGCNLFAITGEAGFRAVEFWATVEDRRKRPWRLAGALGLGTLLAYLFGRLTLEDALARLSERTGAKARAVILPWPEAAVDVDTADDLALAEEFLEHLPTT